MSDPVFGNDKTGSIRDIAMPNKEKELDLKQEVSSPKVENHDDLGGWDSMKGQNKRTGLKLVIALLVLIGLFFLISSWLHKGTVSVWPKKTSVPVVQTFKATGSGEDGTLAFSRVSRFEGSETVFVAGTDEQNVQTAASGKITVKNNSGVQQRFIARTRFETSGGLVYRTPRSVVLPAGGETEITVVADVPGDEYNSDSGLTFKLPGLKGGALYDSISASQSGPLTGGFSGVIKSASDADINAAKDALAESLRSKLTSQLQTKIPDGFIVNPDLIGFSDVTFAEKPNPDKGGIDLAGTATIEAITFKKTDFDSFVASAVLKEYTPGQSVEITNVPKINMLVTTDDFDVSDAEEFEFSLRSPQEGVEFIWQFDESSLLQSVAGKKVSFIEKGLIPELEQAEKVNIDVAPFWKSSMPNNVKKITIDVITE